MIYSVFYRAFRGLQFDIMDPYKRFILPEALNFGKMWNFFEKGRFTGRIWPDWGNTAWADMAGLGSIGLIRYWKWSH